MKKLLFLAIILLISGCEKAVDLEEVENDVREHFEHLETANFGAIIVTSIYDKTAEFEVDFTYNQVENDVVTIVKPENIAGITSEIEKNEGNLKITFEDVSIETLMQDNLGINPNDVLSFAIFDLINSKPNYIVVDEEIKLNFSSGEISKNIFLNRENYDIISIEGYISDEMVILLTTT